VPTIKIYKSQSEDRGDKMTGSQLPVWVAISAIFAILSGTAAGTLAWIGGDKVSVAILKGGAAFVGVLTVAVSIISLFRS